MSAPFDFTAAMRNLCVDISLRVPEFQHVRMDQVAVTFAQARRRVPHGLQAKLTPLRFVDGAVVTRKNGREWMIQRCYANGVEMLYILTFYLPRFQEQSFREKLITVMHELFHISPRFDGDIRRLPGHYHVHSHSQKEFDREMGVIVDAYLRRSPPEDLYAFLQHNFAQLTQRHGRVVGVRAPIPKLLPVPRRA
ncbi:MAG: hypothetical protein NT069_32410 [Planctomycetota bacterium]|nr:hypothetical protein [Planctomycetota bacterium]